MWQLFQYINYSSDFIFNILYNRIHAKGKTFPCCWFLWLFFFHFFYIFLSIFLSMSLAPLSFLYCAWLVSKKGFFNLKLVNVCTTDLEECKWVTSAYIPNHYTYLCIIEILLSTLLLVWHELYWLTSIYILMWLLDKFSVKTTMERRTQTNANVFYIWCFYVLMYWTAHNG